MASTYNFPNHESGDTFPGVTFTILVNGIAENLIGSVVTASFKMQTNPNIIKYLTSTAGQITVAAGGICVIVEQLISWPDGTYNYEIKFVLATGKVKTYITGTFEITNFNG
jgi:hypothetical protein